MKNEILDRVEHGITEYKYMSVNEQTKHLYFSDNWRELKNYKNSLCRCKDVESKFSEDEHVLHLTYQPIYFMCPEGVVNISAIFDNEYVVDEFTLLFESEQELREYYGKKYHLDGMISDDCYLHPRSTGLKYYFRKLFSDLKPYKHTMYALKGKHYLLKTDGNEENRVLSATADSFTVVYLGDK